MPVALVVDRDVGVCRSVSSTLQQAGAAALTAQSAADAIAILQAESPQFLFSGLTLPDRDGISLIADAQRICPAIVVVVISGDTTVESVVQALRLGVCDYVFKPATPQKILAAFDRAKAEIARPNLAAPIETTIDATPPGARIEQDETAASATVTVPLVGDLKSIERQLLKEVIWRCDGNKAAAARTLGMHRRTLYRMLAEKESSASP